MMKNFPIDNQMFWTDELRDDVFELWRTSLMFFNKACELTKQFPKNVPFDIDIQVREASFTISEKIAKASKADDIEIYQDYLMDSVDAIHNALAKMYIANKWGYMRLDNYIETHSQARRLAAQIKELMWFHGLQVA